MIRRPSAAPMSSLFKASVSTLALLPVLGWPVVAAAQVYNCPNGTTSDGGASCTIPAGTTTSGARVRYNAPNADGDERGDDAGPYSLTNNADISSHSSGQYSALEVMLRGGFGYSANNTDATASGDGGDITISNSGALTLDRLEFNTSAGNGAQSGIWDDQGIVYGLFGAAVGQNGVDAVYEEVGGSDGGRAGDGAIVTLTNTGSIALTTTGSVASDASRVGAIAMFGSSTGGAGGDLDKSTDSHKGGASGDAKTVTIRNTGAVTVDASANPVQLAAGIYAEGLSGQGGETGAKGGNGALINLTNDTGGTIRVTNGSSEGSSAWGMYGLSHGGYADNAATESGIPGGDGGGGKAITLTNNGAVTLTASGVLEAEDEFVDRSNGGESKIPNDYIPGFVWQSGGIVGVTVGAAAAASDDGSSSCGRDESTDPCGGHGGNASTLDGKTLAASTVQLSENSTVEVSGDNLIGVGLYGQGGDGGAGRGSDHDGGDGGSVGDFNVNMDQNSRITTDGLNGHGLVIHSEGGPGGPLLAASGIFDFSSDRAGEGGTGSHIRMKGPQGLNGPSAVITTKGDRSIGVVMQSFGGTGGGTENNYVVFDTEPPNAGNGGAPGGIFMNGEVDITTEGDNSHGILAQSIAGDGGTLATSEGLIAVAGSGGDGMAGGSASVYPWGNIVTQGEASIGVVVQSIGGGGGDVYGDGSGTAGVVTIGGQGGEGGDGGQVGLETVPNSSITTSGDYAFGTLLQSIGGGGGNGGAVFNITARVPNVAVGGDGGVGGNGGKVNVTTYEDDSTSISTSITTAGSKAHAMVLQSIGGGGGAGGDARSDSLEIGSLAAIAMAGGGNSAGNGGEVDVDLKRLSLTTTGDTARGLIAQSIGNGGGTGGAASALNVGKGISTAVSIGGQGGEGGNGGPVNIDLSKLRITTGIEGDPDIATFGTGIVAHSVGGGGGTGGSATAGALARQLKIPKSDVTIAIAASVGVGGSGANGGDGGPVTLTLSDTQVTTHGDTGHAILAESIGGGGGAGGDATAHAVAVSLKEKIKEKIKDIGKKPDGKPSAKKPTINTSISAAVGGSSGAGSDGGTVDLTLSGGTLLETFGPSANAINAQSLGGGGGDGGVGSASTSKYGEGMGLKMSIDVGGRGNSGGNGGSVNLTTASDTVITTHGDTARAIAIQSVGGGGGTSQTNSVSFSSPLTDKFFSTVSKGVLKAPRFTVGVGMTGGQGGNGGTYGDLSLDGSVLTLGADADGVLIQSIGGGGGAGGSFGGGGSEEDEDGGIVKKTIDFGLEIVEIKEQVERPWAASFLAGGAGGSGGNGGNISPGANTLHGSVATYGDYADGVVLQSIGGGGGTGGVAVPNDSIGILDLSFRTGGAGGDGGTGGQVNFGLASDADVSTAGYGAHGLVMQSIGGGGGMGGTASRSVASLGLNADASDEEAGEDVEPYDPHENGEYTDPAIIRLGIGASGDGGAGTSGGAVTLTSAGGSRISTAGNHAFGVLAQSVGGGGGAAGIGTAPLTGAELAAETFEDDDVVEAIVDLFNYDFRGAHLDFINGGDGGRGGAGKSVDVSGTYDIVTAGARSFGMIAQSVGGGGGVGGLEGVGQMYHGAVGTVGYGSGVDVTLDKASTIATGGIGAHGVIAQSVSGGGGTTAATIAYGSALRSVDRDDPEDVATALSYAFKLGGDYATVSDSDYDAQTSGDTPPSSTLVADGVIDTSGDYAYGAVSQVVLGGGGTVSVTQPEYDRTKGAVLDQGVVTLGAENTFGDGSTFNGTPANLSQSAGSQLVTRGAGARGLVSQSIGGGGGVIAGFEEAQRASLGETDPVELTIDVQSGASGDTFGQSKLSIAGDVVTLGADADGIVAQAIGGGGGIAGSAGGATATADASGTVSAAGPVTVTGDDTDYALTIELGAKTGSGRGGEFATGGAQPLFHGSVATYGDFAEGLIVQSIGGGGGLAGLSYDPTSDATADLSMHVGASGSASGGAKGVDVALNTGVDEGIVVSTQGYGASGVVIQSIGGGGGIAQSGARNANALRGATMVNGEKGQGIWLGGDYSGSVSGNDAQGAGGGALTVDGGGVSIATRGDDAFGLVAQSIGGGGGLAGVGSSLVTDQGEPGSYSLDYVIGGAKASGASLSAVGADSVAVALDYSSIATAGARSFGLVAQSIEGGGGIATGDKSGIRGIEFKGFSGIDGKYAESGDLSIMMQSTDIGTTGDGAHGVIAQSIAGGGGILGDTTAASGTTARVYGDDLSAYTTAGNIVMELDGSIRTSGDGAHGVVAQSIAGGGGIGGDKDGVFFGSNALEDNAGPVLNTGGSIMIDSFGTIAATGENSVGLFAQSLGQSDRGAVQISVSGDISGGTGGETANGIFVSGGISGTNIENNFIAVASGGSVSAASGHAIRYEGSTSSTSSGMAVSNSGVIDGDVVGYYANGDAILEGDGGTAAKRALAWPKRIAALRLKNNRDGVLTGARRYMADVINQGTLIVGEERGIDRLKVAGDFAQGGRGRTIAAVHFAEGTGDVIQVDGTAALAGTMGLRLKSIVKGGEVTVLTADQGIDGLFGRLTPELFQIEQSLTDTDLTLRATGSRFAEAARGLDDRERDVARYLDDVFEAADPSFGTFFAGFESEGLAATAGSFGDTLLDLSPGASLVGAAANVELSRGRFDALFGCDYAAGAQVDTTRPCIELLASRQYFDQDGTDSLFGYSGGVSTGGVAGRFASSGDWSFSAAFGVETSDFNGEGNGVTSDGDGVFGGVALTRDFGPLDLSFGVAASRSSFDVRRPVNVAGEGGTAKGDYDTGSIAGRIRAAYTMDRGATYLRPMLDLDVIHVTADGYTESGAGKLNLKVDDSEETIWRLAPAVEVGGTYALGGDRTLNAFARAEVSFASEDSFDATTRFAAVDPNWGSLDTGIALAQTAGRLSLGARIMDGESFSVDVGYDGTFSSDFTAHSAQVGMTWRF
ncbi:autotransporter outer membrane beta-barrel domain-containing protein [Tropicimonas isoalkanivorans]|uniref:Autotransporter domain-containing protein n=1 Tax=Tropicimonas isoalkanivorans TaxID=441112 RepID=A0A1I1HLV5_9RHOB|nr:autotransporter outer membrane beta-barrel domain-containing protein [Tropicimonas isoalkanivorans]SFC24831.1 hypothetical protein SAMN04488094_103208 [Tropicimonas isoalkanivorans]